MLAKAAAVAIEVAVVCAAILVALTAFDPVFGLDLGLGSSAAAAGGLAVLGILHGWLALAVGAAVPSRALALAIPAALAAGGYLVAGLHELAGWLDPFPSSPRSGGSARRRCRTASGDRACSSSRLRRWPFWPPPRCSSSGGT